MPGPSQTAVLALRASRIAILKRLAELGAGLIAGVKRRVEVEAPASDALVALSLYFARISRWVRLAIALCWHIQRGDWDEPSPPRPPRPRRDAGLTAEGRAEYRLAAAELRLERDPPDYERPEREERFEPYLERPFGEVVALICRGLGVEPDWEAWAAEPWAQEEIRTRPPTSPYAAWPDAAPRPVPSPPTVIPAEDCEAVRRGGSQGPPARSREPPPPPQGSPP